MKMEENYLFVRELLICKTIGAFYIPSWLGEHRICKWSEKAFVWHRFVAISVIGGKISSTCSKERYDKICGNIREAEANLDWKIIHQQQQRRNTRVSIYIIINIIYIVRMYQSIVNWCVYYSQCYQISTNPLKEIV